LDREEMTCKGPAEVTQAEKDIWHKGQLVRILFSVHWCECHKMNPQKRCRLVYVHLPVCLSFYRRVTQRVCTYYLCMVKIPDSALNFLSYQSTLCNLAIDGVAKQTNPQNNFGRCRFNVISIWHEYLLGKI
jgi:hypothetical protein